MRTTDHSWWRATHTAPEVIAIPTGDEQRAEGSPPQTFSGQTGIVATTRFVAGSIRETLPSPMFEVQIDPSPAAIGCLKPGVAVGSPWISAALVVVAGSIRYIV